jgi:hypothetical protein
MPIDPEIINQAKRCRTCMLGANRLARNDPTLSDADRKLAQKYPRHTIEEAREIDGCQAGRAPAPNGFDFIRWQENDGIY